MGVPQGTVSGTVKTYIADSPVTAGNAVTVGSAANHCTAVTSAGQRVIGIADQTVVAGAPVRVTRSGDAVSTAGGSVTHGQYVKTSASGHLVAVTGTAGGGEEVVGRAETDSTSDGDQLVVFVNPFVL